MQLQELNILFCTRIPIVRLKKTNKYYAGKCFDNDFNDIYTLPNNLNEIEEQNENLR